MKKCVLLNPLKMPYQGRSRKPCPPLSLLMYEIIISMSLKEMKDLKIDIKNTPKLTPSYIIQ